jgi:hypothetical protein
MEEAVDLLRKSKIEAGNDRIAQNVFNAAVD